MVVLRPHCPVRRGAHIDIPDFPKVETAADIPKAHAAILFAVAAGHVTADDVKPLSDLADQWICPVLGIRRLARYRTGGEVFVTTYF
jgi:hypothetical protein